MTPDPYPRIAHLMAGRGTRDDLVLDQAEVDSLLSSEVVVEEKLDGANVTLGAGPHGYPEVGLRGGADSIDRAGHRGPLKAWAAANEPSLRQILADWPVIYAEWMLVSHSVVYDRLPSYLVVLDLWREEGGFAGVDERDTACRKVGLVGPPELWRGTPGTLNRIERLLGDSTWGRDRAEGLVVRRAGPGEPRLAKLVRPGFERISDEVWAAGRSNNRLAGVKATWR